MTTKMEIPVKKITEINDRAVLEKLPEDIRALLGESDGSGYDIEKDRRDLYFERGVVCYQPNATVIKVMID